MKVINFFGGPGCGKTTTALGVAYHLKLLGFKVEYVPEYVKDIVYDDTTDAVTVNDGFLSGRLADQRHIFNEQHRRLYRLHKKVDYVITDGPLFNSIVYSGKGEENKIFHADVFNEFNRYDNLNILLRREIEYKKEGRYQDEAGAIAVDEEVLKCFYYFNVVYQHMSIKNSVDYVVQQIVNSNKVTCERCGAVTDGCKVC